ncbi:MAG: 4-alpha-glucanotransferase [candidate division KSB1 bacterium]|nr:4-alpha-glucanotransferase [candidate division KSB1 bacterium]MDZ7303779.1 4-alpha-glucanotransferase [candidate division KSB1 bacterium]MDZ7313038.1 4-alpha-glucanotransferase [candidate division KSB1 bacterium]
MKNRGSGILLHITSLPSSYGIGDLGPCAYQFADFLISARQCFWQILPLNPTCTAMGNSPYSSYSAFAGNPLLISPDFLVRDGFLRRSNIPRYAPRRDDRVDYEAVIEHKKKLLAVAYGKNKRRLEKDHKFQWFCHENSNWLEDYALFMALKEHFNEFDWSSWPKELRDREKRALGEYKKKFADRIRQEKFTQYLFFQQWFALKNYCKSKNLQFIGDLPIYVSYDSADVWANPELFKLDDQKRPIGVAGVPPDYFSETGQLWGNPVYRWDTLQATRYAWWAKRLEHNLKLFDIIRLDHFRGFVAYWEVPASEETAENGRWIKAPVEDFFSTLFRHFPSLPIIAEDLGEITPDVREIIHRFGLPGMRILMFAFGEDLATSIHAPHNYPENCVVYTGTHDNNTVKGWFTREASAEEKKKLIGYLGREVTEKTVHLELIRLVMSSVAKMVIIPMQDVLGLGRKARMNFPGTPKGNWGWRLRVGQLTPSLAQRLGEMTKIYGRI